jgi:hypothetical protein
MRIEADSVLRHPREAVFAAYRDDIGALIEYLPNVRRIEEAARSEDGHVVRMHKVWHGATELPANLSAKLEERFLSWDDHAVWDGSRWSCEWTIHPHALREAVRCAGHIDFIDLGSGRTRIEMAGDIAIELERVKGVPAFLAGSLARTAESFLVRTISANLVSVNDALAAYLREDTVA